MDLSPITRCLVIPVCLSIGFNTGWVNKQINSANLKFPDQFDGKFFDTNVPTMVSIDKPNINYFDMQVGMNYAYFPNAKTYLNAGFSVQHINQSPGDLFSATTPSDTMTGFLPVTSVL